MAADTQEQRLYVIQENPLCPSEPSDASLTATPRPQPRVRTPRRERLLFSLVIAQAILLVLGGAAILAFVMTAPGEMVAPTVKGPKTNFDSAVYMSECMHPMGGGMVQSGGGFKPLNDTVVSEECASELQQYFSKQEGQYWVDVARVAEAAREYFDTLTTLETPTPKKLIVFDIDETTLSNAEEWQQLLTKRLQRQRQWREEGREGDGWKLGLGQWGWRAGEAGTGSHTPSSLVAAAVGSNGAEEEEAEGEGLEALAALRKAREGLADRPPLAPMLALYQYLFASGYSVAFITGRKESQRNSTAVNLETAGYGRQCRREELYGFYAPGPEALEAEGWRSRRPAAACYVALHLRDMDDDRFASVYKPERRGALVSAGFVIYGNFGDQFSDLDGQFGAPHSFKLPNPAYLIL